MGQQTTPAHNIVFHFRFKHFHLSSENVQPFLHSKMFCEFSRSNNLGLVNFIAGITFAVRVILKVGSVTVLDWVLRLWRGKAYFRDCPLSSHDRTTVLVSYIFGCLQVSLKNMQTSFRGTSCARGLPTYFYLSFIEEKCPDSVSVIVKK